MREPIKSRDLEIITARGFLSRFLTEPRFSGLILDPGPVWNGRSLAKAGGRRVFNWTVQRDESGRSYKNGPGSVHVQTFDSPL